MNCLQQCGAKTSREKLNNPPLPTRKNRSADWKILVYHELLQQNHMLTIGRSKEFRCHTLRLFADPVETGVECLGESTCLYTFGL